MITSPPVGMRSCDHRVCLFACLSRSHSSKTTRPNFLYMFYLYGGPWLDLSSEGNPVLWMTSCFHIMEEIGPNQRRACLPSVSYLLVPLLALALLFTAVNMNKCRLQWMNNKHKTWQKLSTLTLLTTNTKDQHCSVCWTYADGIGLYTTFSCCSMAETASPTHSLNVLTSACMRRAESSLYKKIVLLLCSRISY